MDLKSASISALKIVSVSFPISSTDWVGTAVGPVVGDPPAGGGVIGLVVPDDFQAPELLNQQPDKSIDAVININVCFMKI